MLWLAKYKKCVSYTFKNAYSFKDDDISEQIGLFWGGNSKDVINKICQQNHLTIPESYNGENYVEILEGENTVYIINVNPVDSLMPLR